MSASTRTLVVTSGLLLTAALTKQHPSNDGN